MAQISALIGVPPAQLVLSILSLGMAHWGANDFIVVGNPRDRLQIQGRHVGSFAESKAMFLSQERFVVGKISDFVKPRNTGVPSLSSYH